MPAHKGSAHHLAVLTEEAVRDARRKFRLGNSPKELAEEYGVSSGAMRRALNGVTWKHLNDPEAVDAA
jgi:DNA invertase Pin-like site-specific DNA recombinase